MAWTFETTQAGYAKLWSTIAIKAGGDATGADRFARLIIAAEQRYRAVETITGVPWFFIGALHMRESSCSFAGVLHNGEKIIGTGRKTSLVPAGRGPFTSWEDAAIDALRLKGLHLVQGWTAARMGFEAERYNGLGYVSKGIRSPYVWAGSNHEQPGKYVADHVWDPNANDSQIGVLTVIKRICELRADVALQLGKPTPPIAASKPTSKGTVIAAGATAGAAAGTAAAQAGMSPWVIFGAAVAATAAGAALWAFVMARGRSAGPNPTQTPGGSA